MQRDLMRYALELALIERDSAIGETRAIDLLRRELARAQNAGRFDALSAGEIAVEVVSRGRSTTGVTSYVVELELQERAAQLDDDAAQALVRRAFTSACNASYFLRACVDDDIVVTLLRRASAHVAEPLRHAA